MLEARNRAKSPTRVQEQGARSRERILDAAETLMAEHGFAGTSISAICRTSGLPASSVYWHFENKEGLLEAVMERGLVRMIDEVSSAYEAPGSPRERLHRMMQRAASILDERPREFLRLEMIVTLERSQADDPWRQTSDRFRSSMVSLIEEALYEIFRPTDEEVARQVAIEGARLMQLVGTGARFEAIRDPDTFDPQRTVERAESAILAFAERRFQELQQERSSSS